MRIAVSISSFKILLLLGAGLCAATPACQSSSPDPKDPVPEDPMTFEEAADEASADAALTVVSLDREQVTDDVAHYTVVVRLSDAPGAEIAVHGVVHESSPGMAKATPGAIMLLHGDFATFPSNFLPEPAEPEGPASRGLAGYLAEQGIDVWGVDRRWTRTPADAKDFPGYATMGLAEELDDTGRALAFARAVRALTGSGKEQVFLGGFSHGAQIAYEYAGAETQKPAAERHVKGLVPIDIYDHIAPEDDALRQAACASRDAGKKALESGTLEVDNGFFIDMGQLAGSKPDDPSPLFDGYTNRGVMLGFMGMTWMFFAPTPNYHLVGGEISGDTVSAFRFSPEARIQRWLASAPAYQPTLEGVELDAIWCGEAPRPVPDHLADIQVPLFYIGAAGGFGARGVFTTSLVGSADVKTLVVSKLSAEQEAEDFGHGDLLYSDEAPALAWQPLAAWIQGH
jgi:hypothetical protein